MLAAATHDRSVVIAERHIGPKTNEVPESAPLPREMNERVSLAGHVLTIDAGHTVRARMPITIPSVRHKVAEMAAFRRAPAADQLRAGGLHRHRDKPVPAAKLSWSAIPESLMAFCFPATGPGQGLHLCHL
jgi:hypothetical protein